MSNTTIGVGGSNAATELSKFQSMVEGVEVIGVADYEARLATLRRLMQADNIDCVYLDAGTNLNYFTGVNWSPSERQVGALVGADGALDYIVPAFEEGTFRGMMLLDGGMHCWHEDESSYRLFADVIKARLADECAVALDGATPMFRVDGIQRCISPGTVISVAEVIGVCRRRKSRKEIALMQRANEITLQVHKAAARILREGISVAEVVEFIHNAHKAAGAVAGSYFCIVLFGADTQYPHGVSTPKDLELNDPVLIDTGCVLEGYHSDITRSYIFGTPTERHRDIWNKEKDLQAAAFAAIKLGEPCGIADVAVREHLRTIGLGPDYDLPGVPHRVGHGIGLDIHESPNLVRSDQTPLEPGMCFSVEPMLCMPGEFGIRLEDLIYMSSTGPEWFTQPCHSIDDPFGYQA